MQEIREEMRTTRIKKVIGKTTYDVSLYFSGTSMENAYDKLKRIIIHDWILSKDFKE